MSSSSSDAQRFEALYRAHYAAIVRFACRRIDPGRAEEVVAETFAVAWRRIDEVPAEPLAWLYVVARNVMRGERRAAASERHKAAQVAVAAHDHARDPAEAFAERVAVLGAFATLSETDREALRLVAWEGLDHRAAAAVLGMTRVAFTMRLGRARKRLAAALLEPDVTELSLTATVLLEDHQT